MVRNRKGRKVHVEDSWKIDIKINGNCVYHRNCGIAGFMVLMMILVTQDWQTSGVVLAIVAGSSLVMFFGTGLTTLMRSIEFGLAEFVGS